METEFFYGLLLLLESLMAGPVEGRLSVDVQWMQSLVKGCGTNQECGAREVCRSVVTAMVPGFVPFVQDRKKTAEARGPMERRHIKNGVLTRMTRGPVVTDANGQTGVRSSADSESFQDR